MEYMTVDGDVRHSLKPALPHLRSLTSDGQELQSVGPRPLMMGRRRMDTYLDDARIINIDSYINYNLSSLINSSGPNGVEIRERLNNCTTTKTLLRETMNGRRALFASPSRSWKPTWIPSRVKTWSKT